jgi:uncharacterized C2H2 Zn-finger protein
MRVKRDGVRILHCCRRCGNAIYEDEKHTDKGGGWLFCEHCSINAGFLPKPEEAKGATK